MNIHLKIWNYRGFSDQAPAEFKFGPGFTALIGTNNSGKSSLLRFLYDFRSLFELLGNDNQKWVQHLSLGESMGYSPSGPTEGLFYNGNERNLRVQISACLNPAETEEPQVLEIDYSRNDTLQARHTGSFNGRTKLGPAVIYPHSGLGELLMLLSDTMYVGAFRNVLNVKPVQTTLRGTGDPTYFDLVMGQPFVEWWRDWKSGRDRLANEAAYRLTRDIGRIFGLGPIEINPTPYVDDFQIIADGRSYRLGEFGAGLTQFLVVLANAAYRQPAWILIDEPELNLHPALQLDFLTTLASYAKVGVIFATHSVGLARSVGERLYSCSRNADGHQIIRQFEATPSLPEFLGELSFSAHRELGFETVLLVEGSTDVPVLQQLLRHFGKERKVVLLPLGGAGTINGRSGSQLAEIRRIAPEVVALIDSERTEAEAPLAGDREAFVRDCETLGIRCHVLQRRAIENYFPERAVRAVKGERFSALAPFQLLNDLKPHWAKSENWKIASETRNSDLEGTDLHEFLSTL